VLSVSVGNTQKSLGLESSTNFVIFVTFFLMTCPDECQQDVYSWIVIGIILAFIEKFQAK